MGPIEIRPFRVEDQEKARQLILDGLGEHFGNVQEDLNPDLDDISVSYAGDLFLVAEQAGVIIGCGALIYEGDGIARVQRMSVLRNLRRRGIARAILERLITEARLQGRWRVVIETGFWEDSVGFYTSWGFVETSRDPWGPNMAFDL
ncbi:MAG: GNAT family N-acetyltransferase [Chloroflexi bacterium]|nr:GNAT family N-acetyltransferase [Chloroflexota bacterium]